MAKSHRSGERFVVAFARLTCAFAITAICLLIILHFLRPEIDPSHRMISDYAVGRFGWVMTICFASFSLASALLIPAVARFCSGRTGKVGLAFLFMAAFGLSIAVLFKTDPMLTPPSAATFSGRMHGLAFAIGLPGQLLGALLLTIALRKHPAWSFPALAVLATFIWLSAVVLAISLMQFLKHPAFDQPAAFGWANRALMLAFASWLIAAARPIMMSHLSRD